MLPTSPYHTTSRGLSVRMGVPVVSPCLDHNRNLGLSCACAEISLRTDSKQMPQSVHLSPAQHSDVSLGLNFDKAQHHARVFSSPILQNQLEFVSTSGKGGCKSMKAYGCEAVQELRETPVTELFGFCPSKITSGDEWLLSANDVISDSFQFKTEPTAVESQIDSSGTASEARASCDTLGATGANCIRLARNSNSRVYSSSFKALSRLCEEGQLSEAIEVVKQINRQGILVPPTFFARLLQRCSDEKDTVAGEFLRVLISRCGLENDCFLGSHLIRMFDSLESLSDATDVFKKLSKPNVYAWSAIIAANAKLGQIEEAIDLYYKMQNSCIKADAHVFVEVLKACSSLAALDHGNRIHNHILETGFESNLFVGSTLIDMYNKCGSMEDAQAVFNMLPNKNVVTWNALVAGYIQHGCGQKALQLFQQMQQNGIKPSQVTYISTLQACYGLASFDYAKLIHAHVIESGFGSDGIVGNALIDLYSKWGKFKDAHLVLERLTTVNVVAWSALIAGYMQHGQFHDVIRVFKQMQQNGTLPDEVTFACVLKACSYDATPEKGKQVHSQILERGLDSDMSIGNTLIDMYSKCGCLEHAHMAFHTMPRRDVVSWSALIGGYAELGHGSMALELFKQMQQVTIPNVVTFVGVLKACTNKEALEDGKQIHADMVESGFGADLPLCTTLIDMYGKCASIDCAKVVFDRLLKRDIVSWCALMSAYIEHGHGKEALLLFYQMQDDGQLPNLITFICILKACSSLACLEQGNHIHIQIVEMGFDSDVSLGNTLIDMYGKCGKLEDAHSVFDGLPKRDTTTWNALIAVYAQHGCGQEALHLFHSMQQEGSQVDQVTLTCILKACSSVAALNNGQMIHFYCVQCGLELDTSVGTALIGMYGKCGSLESARKVFDRMHKRDIITWNVLIGEYGHHDNYWLALQSFIELQQAGFVPDDMTFLCLLLACGHVGLVDEGYLHFKSMRDNHGIAPTQEHFNSMVDILGRAGCFSEAEDLLETTVYSSNIVGWTSLLSSCRIHNNVDLGRRCFNHITLMDGGKATPYVIMSNIYAYAGMQEDADRVEELRIRTNAWKKPAIAFTEIDNEVHGFIVGDKKHERSDEIYGKLRTLSIQMQKEGYKPRLDLILNPGSGQEKEDALCGHCERLAIVLGLISTPQGATVRVTKNLRVCADCHLVTKMISKIEMREIVITDVYRTHHFKDGACSCGDYY